MGALLPSLPILLPLILWPTLTLLILLKKGTAISEKRVFLLLLIQLLWIALCYYFCIGLGIYFFATFS